MDSYGVKYVETYGNNVCVHSILLSLICEILLNMLLLLSEPPFDPAFDKDMIIYYIY